jgi:two-component system, NarL family, invasion response regulator UvrY
MKALLVEDHHIVRQGCRQVLTQQPDLEVIEAVTGEQALRLAAEHQPDLVILDLNLPDRRGLDVLRSLLADRSDLKVIVFSMYEELAFVTSAMEAGACGYVTKNDDPDALLEAINSAMRGETYLAASVAKRLALAKLKGEMDALAPLTPRERDLVRLLATGQSLAEVADSLKVSYRTTAELAARLRSRLGLRSNAALIKFAVEQTPR